MLDQHAKGNAPVGWRDQTLSLERSTPHSPATGAASDAHPKPDSQSGALQAALEVLHYGALLCDDNAALLTGNEGGLAVLAERDGLQLKDGRIFIDDSAARARLRSILLGQPSPRERTPVGITGALLVPRPSGLPSYQLTLRKLDSLWRAFGSGESSAWTIMISDPSRTPAAVLRAIAVLYDLTPAETRLAASLISGATPEEIAEQSHVKMPTVRSQLSSLFAKTGTRRQAELVRLFSTVPPLREGSTALP